jgi:hypothetical protein
MRDMPLLDAQPALPSSPADFTFVHLTLSLAFEARASGALVPFGV